MPCGVKTCSLSDDRFLLQCEFCIKKYHAACIGVQRHKETLINAFMVPICADCQPVLRKEADVRKLLHQQERLIESIRSQTDANHRIAADLKKFCLVSELFDSIELLLNDVKENLSLTSNNNQSMCSAVGQLLKSCDSQIHSTITGIKNSNITMSQKITTFVDERLSSVTKDVALSMKRVEEIIDKPQINYESTLREILEDVKSVSDAVSTIKTNSKPCVSPSVKSLEEELSATSLANKKITQTNNDHSSPGWRFFGNKWRWRPDWSSYDGKQRTRRLQEKAAEKALHKRKRRKQQHTKAEAEANNFSKSKNQNNYIRTSDKQLLATAKVQFAGPPSTTDHPIAGLCTPKFINFKKGETINPYRTDKPINNNTSPMEKTTPSVSMDSQSTTRWSLDPMRPPIVNLTQQSAAGDGRFLKARLRDPKIMYLVRIYLAYMHDKEPKFCYDGMTNTSLKMNLASEGLPVSTGELQKIFFEVHEEFGVPRKAASDDLESYRSHLTNQRIQHLQRTKESMDKFYHPSFRK